MISETGKINPIIDARDLSCKSEKNNPAGRPGLDRGSMKPVFFLFFCCLLLCQFAACFAGDILTGIYIINLGRLDISTGVFNADFYLSFKEKPAKDGLLDKLNYEFMNGSAASAELVDNRPGLKIYRIKADLSVPIDLKRFPFEKHTIKIILEDKQLAMDEINFIPDLAGSGLDASVFFPGYTIERWDVQVKEHFYQVYAETFSQFIFTLDISKPLLNAFLKTLLPVIFMVIIVLTSFLMNSQMVESRVAVVTSGLLGAVMFHVSITDQIPPIGYLTVADKVMILTYFIILISFIFGTVMLDLINKGKLDLARKDLYENALYFIYR